MTAMLQNTQLRDIALGRYTKGKTANITSGGAATYQLFTVAGGEVLITALWGKVTTSITVPNTVNLQQDPTTGDTDVIVTATDLGTTDTAAGTVVGTMAQGDGTIDFAPGGLALSGLVVTTGEVESVVTGTAPDGVIEWYCTWVPLTPSATLTASA